MFKNKKVDQTDVVIKELEEIKELIENQSRAIEDLEKSLKLMNELCMKGMES